MSDPRYCLTHLGDSDLLVGTMRLATEDHVRLAELLAHLAELDARRLYVGLGHSSLFGYCQAVLGYSEDETYKRTQAARAAREYPFIFTLVAEGKLHLSAINLLAPHLTAENHHELLVAACHKSKRATEDLVAAHFPRPDVATCLRRLPTPLRSCPAGAVGSSLALPEPAAPGATKQADSAPAAPKLARPAACSVAPRASLEPLSPQRYRLQLTLSRDTRDKLLRAQSLLRHRLPDGDLAQVLDAALNLLCAKLEARKFGKKRAPRGSARPAAPAPAQLDRTSDGKAPAVASLAITPEAAPSPDEPAPGQLDRTSDGKAPAVTSLASTPGAAPSPDEPAPAQLDRANDGKAPGAASPDSTPDAPPFPDAPAPRPSQSKLSRHIPAAVRRAVSARDGHRCSFVSPQGQRCEAQAFLEFHHDPPFARGGRSTVDGLTLRCRAHNDYQACLDFGAAHMLAAKQGKCRGARPGTLWLQRDPAGS